MLDEPICDRGQRRGINLIANSGVSMRYCRDRDSDVVTIQLEECLSGEDVHFSTELKSRPTNLSETAEGGGKLDGDSNFAVERAAGDLGRNVDMRGYL